MVPEGRLELEEQLEELEEKHLQFELDWIRMKPSDFVKKYYRGRWVKR